MPSTDLVVSAAEFAESFTAQAFKGIEAAAIEKQIDAHYYKRAKELYRVVWRKCKKKTGHTFRAEDKYTADEKTCKFCGKPSGDNVDRRMRNGIAALARQLRAADVAAGIEWTP